MSASILWPINAGLKQKCVELLDVVLKSRGAKNFAEPVDWEGLKIPDYPTIIKEPMDLGTVRVRLVEGRYDRLEQFANGVRLVWNNCYMFNQPTTDPYKEQGLQEAERDAAR